MSIILTQIAPRPGIVLAGFPQRPAAFRHGLLTGTPTLVSGQTPIFQTPIFFLFAPIRQGTPLRSRHSPDDPIGYVVDLSRLPELFYRIFPHSQFTFTDSPDESPFSDSQPITFTDSPDDPPSQTASQLPSRTLRRCRATMSCDDVVRRCRAKMSCEDVVRRCRAKMSCKDVVRRCRAKMS